jgi:hypothetical protein
MTANRIKAKLLKFLIKRGGFDYKDDDYMKSADWTVTHLESFRKKDLSRVRVEWGWLWANIFLATPHTMMFFKEGINVTLTGWIPWSAVIDPFVQKNFKNHEDIYDVLDSIE